MIGLKVMASDVARGPAHAWLTRKIKHLINGHFTTLLFNGKQLKAFLYSLKQGKSLYSTQFWKLTFLGVMCQICIYSKNQNFLHYNNTFSMRNLNWSKLFISIYQYSWNSSRVAHSGLQSRGKTWKWEKMIRRTSE